MPSFGIQVDHDSLKLGSGGNVDGKIHVVLGEDPFPEPGWWDFPCVILGWWLLESRKLEEQGRCTLTFMDGPASVDCVRDRTGKIVVTPCLNGQAAGAAGHVSRETLASEIRRAASGTARACAARGLPTQGLPL